MNIGISFTIPKEGIGLNFLNTYTKAAVVALRRRLEDRFNLQHFVDFNIEPMIHSFVVAKENGDFSLRFLLDTKKIEELEGFIEEESE